MPPLDGVYYPVLQTSNLTAPSGLSNVSNGIVASKEGTTGIGTIALPHPIDPTKPWRIAVLAQLNETSATNGYGIGIAFATSLNNSSGYFGWTYSGTWGFSGGGMNKYTGVGGTGPSPGTWVWFTAQSDGNYISLCMFPSPLTEINFSGSTFGGKWTGSNYCVETLPAALAYNNLPVFQGMYSIVVSSASTSDVIAGVYVSEGRLDGPSDGRLEPPMYLNLHIALDPTTPVGQPYADTYLFVPGAYGQPQGTPLVLFNHSNNSWPAEEGATFPTLTALFNDGYAIVAPSALAPSAGNDPENALDSNWGGPSGNLWRKMSVDWVRANLPATWQLYHIGTSMGGLDALTYEMTWPGSAAILCISCENNLTAVYTLGGTGPWSGQGLIQSAFGDWYLATAPNTNQNPATTAGSWQKIATGPAPIPQSYLNPAAYTFEDRWSGAATYAPGQFVNVLSAAIANNLQTYDPYLHPEKFVNVPIYSSYCALDTQWDGTYWPVMQSEINNLGGHVTLNVQTNGTCGDTTLDLFDPGAMVAFFDKYRQRNSSAQSGTGPTLGAATTTALAVTSGGSAVATIAAGNVVTLAATVNAGGTPAAGQVDFCDGTAAPCTGIHLMGSAQLTGNGTAVLKLVPGIGSHSYSAVFTGTGTAASSSSDATALTVTGLYPTMTSITQSGTVGNYSLAATVSGSGGTATPTGPVTFLDASKDNAVLGMAVLAQGGAALTWLNSQTPAAGSGPGSVVAADLNGDGKLDLAAANLSDNTVTVLLGNGDGTFTAAPSPVTGARPAAVAVGDFNRDGNPDLAVANFQDGTVTVLLGNGDGTFTAAPVSPATGTHPTALAVGDFNGDGKLDLAVANGGDNTVTVLLGNGDGTFTRAAVAPATGGYPDSIAVGDFNGDGNLDLAVANGNDNTITILRGNGDGTFTAAASPATGVQPVWIAAGDFNGDGMTDLAVANYGDNTITVLLGNGDATFAAAPTLSSGANPEYIAVADFNKDGNLDLAVASSGLNKATVLLGNGDGTFANSAAGPATGSYSNSVAAGDFNGDGEQDLAITNFRDNTVTVQLGQMTQSATATISGIAPVGAGTHQIQASYLGDGSYNSSTSGATGLTAQPILPAVTWATPAAISYGTALSATQLDASSAVSGTFAYSPAPGTVLAVGSHTLSATFTPADATDYAAATATVTLAVNQATPAITWATPAAISYGTALSATQLNASSPVSGTFAYSPAPGTVLAVGSHTLSVTFTPADATDYATATATVTLAVNRATPAITWATPAAISYGTALSAAQLDASSATSGVFVYTPAAGTVPGTGPQTLLVSFTPADTADYTPATATVSLAVNKATQTIAFAPLSSPVIFGVRPVPLTATASSGLGVAFSVTGPAAISGNTLTITGAGPVVVTANQAGNGNYSAAAPAQQTISVNRAAPAASIAASAASVTVGSPVTLTATLKGSGAAPGGAVTFNAGTAALGTAALNSGVATLAVTSLVTGKNTITANYTGDANYAAATSASISVTVLPKATPTVKLTSSVSTQAYGSPVTLTATLTGSGARPTGTVAFNSGSAQLGVSTLNGSGAATLALTTLAVGKSSITASYSGDSSYAPAASTAISVTVNKATQTIAFTRLLSPITYGASPVTLVATASSGLGVTFTVTGPAKLGGNTLTLTGPGTVVVTASQAGNANYAAASPVSQTVNVNKAAQTISFPRLSSPVTFGVSPIALPATASSGLTVTYSVTGPAKISGSTLTLTGAGTVVVTASQAGNANYLAANNVSQSISVGKAAQTISFTPLLSTVSYGVSPIALSATASSGLAVTYSVTGPAKISGSTLPLTGAGTVVVTASQAGNANYLAANNVSQSISVGKAAQTISFTPLLSTVSYGVSPIALSATASSGLGVTFTVTGPAKLSGKTLTLTGAGTVVVTASQAGNANYLAATAVSQSITVNSAAASGLPRPVAPVAPKPASSGIVPQ
jgi:hypothetical protein